MSRAQLAKEKKLKQEQKIATAFSRAETVTLMAATLRGQLAKIEAAAPPAKRVYSQKRAKGASGASAPNFSPIAAAPA